jgi:hypothetical protein
MEAWRRVTADEESTILWEEFDDDEKKAKLLMLAMLEVTEDAREPRIVGIGKVHIFKKVWRERLHPWVPHYGFLYEEGGDD